MSKVFEFREWLIQLEEGVHADLARSILTQIYDEPESLQRVYGLRQGRRTGPSISTKDALKSLSDISPEPKYIPVLAFFVARAHEEFVVPDLTHHALMKEYIDKFKSLVDRKKLVFKGQKPNGHVDKDGVFIGMPAQQGKEQKINDWLKFTEMVDGIYGTMRPSKSGANDAQPIDADPVFSIPGKIDIYEANSQQACIKYGQGYDFCISHGSPEKNLWQSYRDISSTFYFVMDRTLDKSNPLHMVVVNVKSSWAAGAMRAGDRPERVDNIELTDASNRTGTIAQFGEDANKYMEHLIGRGVPIKRIFKSIPKTKEEEEEQRKLGEFKADANWFRKLSYDEKSKYIGRGHKLTDDQFNLLWENKSLDLLSKYVAFGRILITDKRSNRREQEIQAGTAKPLDFQLVTTLSDKKLKEAYLRVRAIYAGEGDEEGIGELVPQEVKEMSAAQIKQAKQSIKNRGVGVFWVKGVQLALKAGFKDLAEDLLRHYFTADHMKVTNIVQQEGVIKTLLAYAGKTPAAKGWIPYMQIPLRGTLPEFEDVAKDLIQQKFDWTPPPTTEPVPTPGLGRTAEEQQRHDAIGLALNAGFKDLAKQLRLTDDRIHRHIPRQASRYSSWSPSDG